MKKLLLIVAIIVAVLLVAGIGAYLFFNSQQNSSPTASSTNPFGFSSSTSSNTTQGTAPMTTIQTNTGGTLQVPDPTVGKTPIPEGSNTYYYLTNNQDTQGDNAQFDIEYGNDSSISIVLLKEPLSASRLAAEQSLRKLFPLTDTQLCSLITTVAVPSSINSIYSGENLGLSFCAGAVQLP